MKKTKKIWALLLTLVLVLQLPLTALAEDEPDVGLPPEPQTEAAPVEESAAEADLLAAPPAEERWLVTEFKIDGVLWSIYGGPFPDVYY